MNIIPYIYLAMVAITIISIILWLIAFIYSKVKAWLNGEDLIIGEDQSEEWDYYK